MGRGGSVPVMGQYLPRPTRTGKEDAGALPRCHGAHEPREQRWCHGGTGWWQEDGVVREHAAARTLHCCWPSSLRLSFLCLHAPAAGQWPGGCRQGCSSGPIQTTGSLMLSLLAYFVAPTVTLRCDLGYGINEGFAVSKGAPGRACGERKVWL